MVAEFQMNMDSYCLIPPEQHYVLLAAVGKRTPFYIYYLIKTTYIGKSLRMFKVALSRPS